MSASAYRSSVTIVLQPSQGDSQQESSVRMLSGVPPIPGWGPSSGALFSCLRYLGEPVGYPFLAAVSGDAFRLHVIELRSHGPSDGVDIAGTLRNLGYEVQAISASQREQVAQAISQSIEAGVPAIAWSPSTEAGPWFGVVAGWKPDDATVYLKTLGDGEGHRAEPLERVATAPCAGQPGLYLPGDRATEPPRRELVWSALRQAVRLGREQVNTSAEKHPFIGFGVRGYEAWANFLEEKGSQDRSALTEADRVHGVWMHLAVAVDMKQQAESFLGSAMQEAEGEARSRLGNAAELYHEIWDLLAWVQPHFAGFSRCRWALSDKERTKELIRVLRRVAFLEEMALDAVAKALRSRA